MGFETPRAGIRELLAFARPQPLLLDEITSQLDARNELALRDAIPRASTGCMVIVLDEGEVSGTHEESC